MDNTKSSIKTIFPKTIVRVSQNKQEDIIKLNTGDITHDNTIPDTPPTYGNVSLSSYHITQLLPFNAIVIPIIPPTAE